MGNETIDRAYQLGVGRLREHWLNHAERCFRQVLAADAQHSAAKHQLGLTLFLMKRRDEGIALMRDALAAEPELNQRRTDLAAALQGAGRQSESDAVWAEAVRREPALSEARERVRTEFSCERNRYTQKIIDYDYHPEPRHSRGRGTHRELAALLAARDDTYRDYVQSFADVRRIWEGVLADGSYDTATPFWLNTWMPPLDAIALMGILAKHRPKHYLEIGSGMSTKFARRAISALGLSTRVVSVDPQPRSEIDALAQQIIRKPLEHVSASLFEGLEPGDVLFFDGSHRSFPGSDVTVFFLEILPRLPPGVIVQIHDIYLPDDYAAGHVNRFWNEQYLLASALLYGSRGLQVLFPCWYVSQHEGLAAQVASTLRPGELASLYVHGVSFWLQTVERG